jgi:hypothetical protein
MASASIQSTHLPSELEFLKSGYNTTLGHDDLTAPGMFVPGIRVAYLTGFCFDLQLQTEVSTTSH